MKKTYQRPIAESLKPSSSRLGKLAQKVTQLQRINQQLQAILSDELRPYCRAINLREQVLVIAVDNASWLTYLRFGRTELLSQLRHHYPSLIDIHFIVSPPSQRAATPLKPTEPISTHASEMLKSTAKIIGDEKLSEALFKLANNTKKKDV